MESTCSIESCDQPAYCKGICRRHYNQAHRKVKAAKAALPDRECARCGVVFAPTNARMVYCSQHCNLEAWRQRQRDGAEKPTERICMQCQQPYTPQRTFAADDPYQRGRFCSRACKDRAMQADGRHGMAQRKWQFKTNFGITIEQYQAMKEAQGGACAICKRDEPNGRVSKHGDEYWLHVDHDHVTGRVRGLLCMECNTLLGKAEDSPERLEAAAAYLRQTVGAVATV